MSKKEIQNVLGQYIDANIVYMYWELKNFVIHFTIPNTDRKRQDEWDLCQFIGKTYREKISSITLDEIKKKQVNAVSFDKEKICRSINKLSDFNFSTDIMAYMMTSEEYERVWEFINYTSVLKDEGFRTIFLKFLHDSRCRNKIIKRKSIEIFKGFEDLQTEILTQYFCNNNLW